MKKHYLILALCGPLTFGTLAAQTAAKQVRGAQITATTAAAPAAAPQHSAQAGRTDYTDGTLSYTVNDDGSATLTKCSQQVTQAVTVPDSIPYNGSNHTVIAVAAEAFSECAWMPAVTLPKTVAAIGSSAFDGCKKLTAITVAEGNEAFVARDGVLYSKDLTRLVAYPGGKTGTSYAIAEGVQTIEDGAFAGCEQLAEITLPDGLEIVGDNAFEHCTALTSLTLPEGVKSAGTYAFANCYQLAEIVLPKSLTKLGSWAFNHCSKLPALTLPDGLTVIDGHTFDHCSALAEVKIPASLLAIGAYAFTNCTSLASVTLPQSLMAIGESAFSYCTSLADINVAAGNRYYASIDGVLFNGDKTKLIAYPVGKTVTNYDVPAGTQTIGNGAFRGYDKLESVSLPESVTSLEDYAFSGCKSLKRVAFSLGLTQLGKYAFSDCTALDSVALPDGLTTISDYAFSYCEKLKSLTLPRGLQSLGDYALAYCSDLETLALPETLTHIGNNTLGYCSGLTSLTLPKGIDDVPGYSFYGCFLMQAVYLLNDQPTNFYETGLDCTHYVPASALDTYQQGYDDQYGAIQPIPTAKLEVAEAGYGSLYVSDESYVMPEGLEGGIVTLANAQTGEQAPSLTVDYVYQPGDYVPAATPLLVKGTAGEYDRYQLPAQSLRSKHDVNLAANLLRGTDTATETTTEGAKGDVVYYKLGYDAEGKNYGFHWGAPDGGAFTNEAHACYLALPYESFGQIAHLTLDADGQPTGIVEIEAATAHEDDQNVYTLDGRKVIASAKLPQGIYIVNGQKRIVK